MKIGILSDIHSNIIALEKVLVFLEHETVDKLFILGDFIGYYYQPLKVIETLQKYNCSWIVGNHEKMLLKALLSDKYLDQITEKYGHGIKVAMEQLPQTQIEWISTLPDKIEVEIDNLHFLLCHGSPWDADYYVYPNAPEEVLSKFNSYDHDFILLGHTHYPLVFSLHHSLIINPGSIGQSRMIGGVANFGIIDTKSKTYKPISIPYPIEKVKEEAIKFDSNLSYLTSILTRNRD